jgi:hypothetical protein
MKTVRCGAALAIGIGEPAGAGDAVVTGPLGEVPACCGLDVWAVGDGGGDCGAGLGLGGTGAR